MGPIFRLLKAFFDGFFPVIGIAIFLLGSWFVYHNSFNELTKLPLIIELTDAYKTGWKETVDFGGKISTRLVELDIEKPFLEQIKGESGGFYEQNGVDYVENGSLLIEVTWEGRAIEEKFLKQGWSSKKINAAYAYLTYIDLYMDDAIQDMYSTGVSASITIAQGILESNAGRSGLATKTNNHFGIKARPNKEGRRKIKAKQFNEIRDADFNYSKPAIGVSQHFDDNRYDRFEVYKNVLDSYERHSSLLQNTCKVARKGCYAWIWKEFPVQEDYVDIKEMATVFQKVSGYAPKDFFGKTKLPYYAAQAAGLKMAGYATSKTYHEKLVYLIETYELWRLDVALIKAIANDE